MFNIDLDSFNFFVIDKYNWKNQKEMLFGYKTVGNEGIWLEIKWSGNEISIFGSTIQPYVFIYNIDDYWAISNNYYLLIEHLNSKNITAYDKIITNTNFSYIKISENGISLPQLQTKYFTKELSQSKDIILNWSKKYTQFCNEIPNGKLISDFSGGFKSRILYNLYKEKDNMIIKSNWQKKGETERYYDGLLARLYLKKHFNKSHKVIAINSHNFKNKKDDIPNKPVYSEDEIDFLSKLFENNKDKILENNIDNKLIANNKNIIYHLSGNGFDTSKYDLEEIRINLVNRALYQYYVKGEKFIYPFIDTELLKIKDLNSLIIIALLKINDSSIPYYSKDEMHFISDNDIEKVLEIFKED